MNLASVARPLASVNCDRTLNGLKKRMSLPTSHLIMRRFGCSTYNGVPMAYKHIRVPADGTKITVKADGSLSVPNNPIIPFIEGDGIGVDITPVMKAVVDAAVAKAYRGTRAIRWMEIYSGEKSLEVYGEDQWLPPETLTAMREFVVGIKGPMTTPVGG